MSAAVQSTASKGAPTKTAAPVRRSAVIAPGHASERQARGVAHAALQGERDLARRLTPTPAAPTPGLGDSASPLPLALRTLAEDRLGADLAAVRLHTGAAAARFATDHDAHALTAGRDIYFAEGRFDPVSPAGLDLLLHEIAHVLQQTGRLTSRGRLAATAVSGRGWLQREEAPTGRALTDAEIAFSLEVERKKVSSALKAAHGKQAEQSGKVGLDLWSRMTFKALVDGHRPDAAGQAYDDLAEAVAAALGFSSNEDASWSSATWPAVAPEIGEAFAGDTLAKLKSDSRFSGLFVANGAGYGLIYDCLKKLGLFDAAIDLLAASPRLKTLHWHGGMSLRVDSAAGADVAGFLLGEQSEAGALFKALEKRVHQAVFVPTLGLEPLMVDQDGASTELAVWIGGLLRNARSQDLRLVDNELVFGVYLPIFSADAGIEAAIRQTLEDPGAAIRGRAGAEARYYLARTFLAQGGAYRGLSGDEHGYLAKAAMAPIGGPMAAAGERATHYWRQAMAVSQTGFRTAPAVLADPVGLAVQASLARQAERFFRLEGGAAQELPAPAAYARRVAAWRTALAADMDRVDQGLQRQRRRLDAAAGDRDSNIGGDPQMAFYGVLINGLSAAIGATLAQYAAAEDRKATEQLRVEDVRGAHRLMTAASLLQFAEAVGWAPLAARANDWLKSRDRQASHIYLLSDWELSSPASSALSRMTDEISGTIANWPVSGVGLATVFSILETRARAHALERLIAVPPPTGEGDRPLHREVDRKVADLPVPRRWEVKRYAFALDRRLTERAEQAGRKAVAEAEKPSTEKAPPDVGMVSPDLTPPPGMALAQLLAGHPKTLALHRTLQMTSPDAGLAMPAYDRLRGGVRPFSAEGMLPVFAWEVPSLDVVVGVVRVSATLNQKVLDQLRLKDAKLPLDAQTPEGQGVLARYDNARWADQLFAALELGGGLDAATALREDMDLNRALDDERVRYRGDLRIAAVGERQRLVTRHRAALADQELTVRVLAPRNALADLKDVVGQMFPTAQMALDKVISLGPPLRPLAEVHQALAVLELAPDIAPGIRRALSNYDTALIAGYLALIPKTLATAETVLTAKDETSRALVQAAGVGPERLSALLDNRALLTELVRVLETQRIEHQVAMGFRGEVHQEKSDYDSFKEAHPDLGKFASESAAARTVVRLFGADKANPAFLNGVKHAMPLTAGMLIGDWELVDVLNPFTYLPSFRGDSDGDRAHPGFRKGMVARGYLQADQAQALAMLSLDEGNEARLAAATYSDREALFSIRRVGSDEDTFVFAGDTAVLDEMSNSINIGSIVAGLEASAEVIKFILDLTIDVVALLFGGVGQAAKTSAEMLAITQSEEFKTLVEAFQKDPTKLVTQVIDTLAEKVLQPSFLMEYLLFPKGGIIEALASLARGSGAPKKPGAGATRKSNFGKVLGAVLDLGKHVAGAFQRLHERFQGPMAGLRGNVVSHPRLRWGLELVAKYGPTIVTIISLVKQAVDEHPNLADQIAAIVTGEGKTQKRVVDEKPQQPDSQDQMGADLSGGSLRTLFQTLYDEKVDALDTELGKVMDNLSQFELPKEIVPLNLLVGAAVDLVLKLAGKSAKGKLAVLALEKSGIKDIYVEELAKTITEAGGDPNRLWSEIFLPSLGPQFGEFRDQAVDELYGVIDESLGLLRGGLSASTGQPVEARRFAYGGPREAITVTPVEGDFTAPLQDPDALTPAWTGGVRLPSSAGAPLDSAVRASAEARFGHDFKHVRVHAGAEGAATAQPVRALGLTSGSHVFLDPKVSQTSRDGREVLDHELTHVLQQTGPRPLGESHDARPRRGAARKGLTVDRHDEDEAAQTAKAVRDRRDAAPVAITPRSDEEGIAPAFDPNIAFDLLGLITSYKGVADFAGDLDRLAALHKDKSDDIQTMAVGLWTSLLAKPLSDKATGYAKPFDSQQPHIHSYLTGHSETIKKAIPVIVEKTWITIQPKKPKSGGAKPPAKHEFRPFAFAGALSAYVFAKTGVAISIDLDQSSADKTKATLKGARVHYINLGKVPIDHPLWTELKWKAAFGPDRRRELAARMAVLDPMPGVWSAAAYQLDSEFLADADRRADNRPTDKLPGKAAYISTGSKNREGLRLGSHGDLTGAAQGPFGKNRESHHTTQYLLAQYFHNERTLQKPFKTGVQYPGVQREGDKGDEGLVKQITGKKDIKVAATAGPSGRGDPMPALLIAAETHRQGRLHVGREGKWIAAEEAAGSLTQGYAIDNTFRAKLPPWLNRLEAKSTQELNQQVDGRSSDTVREAIYSAAQDTYRWMYSNVMGPALRDALVRNELAYYRGLAARTEANIENKTTGKLHATYDLKADDLAGIASLAAQRNSTVMGGFGWVL